MKFDWSRVEFLAIGDVPWTEVDGLAFMRRVEQIVDEECERKERTQQAAPAGDAS